MSDELIYRVKFEADDKSLAEVKRQANEAQSTKTTSGGRGGQGTEKEISALKQLSNEPLLEELPKLNKLSSEKTPWYRRNVMLSQLESR